MKHTIWSNRNINPDDWKADYLDCMEINEEDMDEDELWYWIHDQLSCYLDDERANLNIPTEGRILVIGDLGLWHGRVPAYKVINANVKNILSFEYEYAEFYDDGHNVKGIEVHHDGTNYYEYRVIREDRNIQNLLNAIYNGEEITRKKLNYYTKSLHPYVAKIYGW